MDVYVEDALLWRIVPLLVLGLENPVDKVEVASLNDFILQMY
jgi:hypothetical protein